MCGGTYEAPVSTGSRREPIASFSLGCSSWGEDDCGCDCSGSDMIRWDVTVENLGFEMELVIM